LKSLQSGPWSGTANAGELTALPAGQAAGLDHMLT
jgi:hypothetical protein